MCNFNFKKMERKTSEYPNYKYDYIKLLQRKTFYLKKYGIKNSKPDRLYNAD